MSPIGQRIPVTEFGRFPPRPERLRATKGTELMTDIGRLTEVNIREVWKSESQDFTPWLLENADALGKALGMELDLHEAEHSVGDFSLDLIGEEVNTGNKVIIENQLERSNHRHLGQLLTYAGGTDPASIVWITDEFRDEHRAALDWLNERTDEETRFFGVEIGAVQIGDSPVAPQFRVVASPNSWQKEVKGSTAAGLSKRQENYLRFWTLFSDEMKAQGQTWTSRDPSKRLWMVFPTGTSLARYAAGITQKYVKVEIYINRGSQDENVQYLNTLRIYAEHFEKAIGEPLSWEPLPHAKAARVAVYKEADFKKESLWPEEVKWMVTKLAAFRDTVEELGGMPHLLNSD